MTRYFILCCLLFCVAVPVAAHEDEDENDSESITYWHDVKPILEANCTTCHQEGEIGGFSLETYADAVMAAPVIADTTLSGYMPPWPPGGDTPPLVGARGLSDAEIETLVRWAFTLEEGDPADYDHATITTATEPTIRADMTLDMPVTYTPNAENKDDYRCFLIDPGLTEDVIVSGYDIIPGAPSVVHHVLLFKAPGDAREQAAILEAEDERDGWECFGGPRTPMDYSGFLQGLGSSASLANSIGAWAPGTSAIIFPEGTGDLLRADDLIVMQVHYNLEAGAAPDRTRAILQTEPYTDASMPLGAINLSAPVEIPCAADADSALCDRAEMLREQRQVESNLRGAIRAEGLLRRCNQDVANYLAQDAANVVSDCDRIISVDGFAVGTAGHMHERGTAISITLNAESDQPQTILDIPEWDFHWQSGYLFENPIPVNAGDILTITCQWDNSDGDRYIIWGEGTNDEMCLGSVTILPLPDDMTHEQFRAAHPELFPTMNDHDMDNHDMDNLAEHDHSAQVEILPGEPVPALTAQVIQNGNDLVLLLDVTDFTFAPERVDMPHVPGEGHAHLYINGEKITRLYDTAYNLGELSSGDHIIRVTLNANNHGELTIDGQPIAAEVTVTVP